MNTESSCLDLKFPNWADSWFGRDLISPLGKVRHLVVEWTPQQTSSYLVAMDRLTLSESSRRPVHMVKERESRRQTRWTHTGATVQFFSELPCLILPTSKSSMVCIIFWTHTQILMVTPVASMLHVDIPPSSIPSIQFTWHFHWRTTCILFTLRNRCTSCYSTHKLCGISTVEQSASCLL